MSDQAQTPTEPQKPVRHYRNLGGPHHGRNEDGGEQDYVRGEIIHTRDELLKFNRDGMQPKFEEIHNYNPKTVHENTTVAKPFESSPPLKANLGMDTLRSMSAQDLLKFCQEEEINPGKETRKDQLLKIIETALAR